jgi:hypothetical protein
MSQAQFSAFQSLFDRAVSVVLLSLSALVTGAVVVVGG